MKLLNNSPGITGEAGQASMSSRATRLASGAVISTTLKVAALVLVLTLLNGCGEFFRGSDDLIGLTISPINTSIQPGNTQQFSATGTFGDNSTGDVTARVNWKSSDPSLATIDSTGLATGITYGKVTISASDQGYTAKTVLSISSQTVTISSIAVTPSDSTILLGATQQFVATATYSNGSTSVITSSAVWSSSDGSVVTIRTGGLATGVARGNATITATSGNVSGTTTLTVQ
jgi:uncharacterized protein YjdB